MNFEDKIKELNIKLPEAKAPVGNYVAAKITGKMLANNIIRYISNRAYWDPESTREVGWLETIEVGKIGKIRAKMDTGNGAHACSMHAEDIKISGKTVSWTYDGKRYSAPKYGESRVFRANAVGQEPSEIRTTVLLFI